MKYTYPILPELNELMNDIQNYSRCKADYAGDISKIQVILDETGSFLEKQLHRIADLDDDSTLALQEPDLLPEIKQLRDPGPRILWKCFNPDVYENKLQGAFIGRLAGCTLGAPVEFWSVEKMEKWSDYTNDSFPPEDYWSEIKNPDETRYEISRFRDYTKPYMDHVPADDDITYTILGLLIMEEYGVDFRTSDVGKSWLSHLPHACTAERVALENLRSGLNTDSIAVTDNPYVEWIGAYIRSDPWAYMAPGLPEKSAEYAWRDAYLSHRRNGIYGEMFFSAAISAAFHSSDASEALSIALTEIPSQCRLTENVRWALDESRFIRNHHEAREAVDSRFRGMAGAHTINNACLTIFGLMIGKSDFTKVISETVAMGLDNDCNAATAGSIAGALYGIDNIPSHWYAPFNNKILTYIDKKRCFRIDDLLSRFQIQAKKTFNQL